MPVTNKIKKSIFRYGWYIMLAANIIAVALMFMSIMAWKVSPEKTTLFAYLGLGFVFILTANILFLLFWLIFLKWKFALLPFIALLICINPILTYFPIHSKSKEIPEGSIKILSYNIRGFSWFNDRKKKENQTLTYIRNSGADIICLQEFMMFGNNKHISREAIEKALKKYPYRSYTSLDSRKSGNLYGMACFSKYPILETTQIPIETRDNAGSVVYKIQLKDKVISVFNNHLESNRLTSEDRKLYQKLRSETERPALDSIAQSLTRRLSPAYRKRAKQADIVNTWIQNHKTDGVIVCGDFNDTPISYTYNKIKGELEDSFAESGFGVGITYHENHFWFRIDFIMHSSNIKAYNCTIDKVKYSDHYPVWAFLKIE